MLDMLITATVQRKLGWKYIGEYYTTFIEKCAIKLSSSFDFEVEETTYTLSLFNSDGLKFADYYSSTSGDDAQECDKIGILYAAVKDSIFRIKESETNILKGLEQLTKTEQYVQ